MTPQRMTLVWIGCCLILSIVASAEAMRFPEPRWPPYNHKKMLNENFFLFWTPNSTNNEITFEIQARTKGYVGFGLGTGNGMIGADIVVGWVKDGKGFLQDMHAVKNDMPLLDAQQDWQLLNAEENHHFTILRFSRPYDTGDCTDDRVITIDTMDIIWSYGLTDELKYHENSRGNTVLQILDNDHPVHLNEMPADTKSFEMRVHNVRIPASKTTLYWCYVIALPKLHKKHHIIRYSRILDPNNALHHVGTYACYDHISDPAMYNTGYECFTPDVPAELNNCREAIMVWAVGGEEFVNMPNDAGISLGTDDDVKYLMFQMHYENKDSKEMVDRSGLKIWYTPTLRQHDMGTLVVGADMTATQIIPPQSIFTTYGICHSECTKQHITEAGGLHMFSYFLHSHLLGRQVRVRRIRDGAQIDWLGKDENYDFNYQQTRIFANETVLLPGDMLVTECGLDSSDRDNVTFGGLSTYNEMCLAFLNYYPRMKMVWCFSHVSPQLQATVLDNHADVKIDDNGTVLSPDSHRGESFTELFWSAQWNADRAARLQKVQTTAPHTYSCEYMNNTIIKIKSMALPFPKYTQLSIQDSVCSRKERVTATSTAPSHNRVSTTQLISIMMLASVFRTAALH